MDDNAVVGRVDAALSGARDARRFRRRLAWCAVVLALAHALAVYLIYFHRRIRLKAS